MAVYPEELVIVLPNCISACEDVIEPCMNIHADLLMEDPSQDLLECRRSIAISLPHNVRFECTIWSGKTAILNAVHFNTDLLIGIGHINFRSISFMCHAIH